MNQETNVSISFDYKSSFLYENEKGTWLVLVSLLSNLSDQPQEVRYEFLPSGELCEKIITPAPEVPKDRESFPLPPNTVEATMDSDIFFLSPKESRKDTLIVNKLHKEEEWRLVITEDVSVIIDKSQLRVKQNL